MSPPQADEHWQVSPLPLTTGPKDTESPPPQITKYPKREFLPCGIHRPSILCLRSGMALGLPWPSLHPPLALSRPERRRPPATSHEYSAKHLLMTEPSVDDDLHDSGHSCAGHERRRTRLWLIFRRLLPNDLVLALTANFTAAAVWPTSSQAFPLDLSRRLHSLPPSLADFLFLIDSNMVLGGCFCHVPGSKTTRQAFQGRSLTFGTVSSVSGIVSSVRSCPSR
ncbi:hypothetical protein E2C01_018137 [Portunus trituberculatus]|uniref:Uncharacterized protein n=1 Tax=Portunus trituberculatus TaxID=210409 RepID=A0A5B7DVD3_PORTR|nr:hypothetical protein [Portunus trituberculatus]